MSVRSSKLCREQISFNIMLDHKMFRIAFGQLTYYLTQSLDKGFDDSCPCDRCKSSEKDRCLPPLLWARTESGTWYSNCCTLPQPRPLRWCPPRDSPRTRLSPVARLMTVRRVWCVCCGRSKESLAAAFCTACSLSGVPVAPVTLAPWLIPSKYRCPRSSC